MSVFCVIFFPLPPEVTLVPSHTTSSCLVPWLLPASLRLQGLGSPPGELPTTCPLSELLPVCSWEACPVRPDEKEIPGFRVSALLEHRKPPGWEERGFHCVMPTLRPLALQEQRCWPKWVPSGRQRAVSRESREAARGPGARRVLAYPGPSVLSPLVTHSALSLPAALGPPGVALRASGRCAARRMRSWGMGLNKS